MFPLACQDRLGRTFEIRFLTEGDGASCVSYLNDVAGETNFLSFGTGEYKLTPDEQDKQIVSTMKTKNSVLLGVWYQSDLIAVGSIFGAIRPRTQHVGEVGISVRKSHWGIGVGTQLFDALMEWSKASGVLEKLTLKVQVDNERAIPMYLNKGFKIEGTMSKELKIGNDYFDHHVMGLWLAKPK